MNPRTHEVELPVVAETQAEVPRIGRRRPTCPTEPSGTVQPEREGARTAEERSKLGACAEPEGHSFRFEDPYWDDAFDSYHNPTLRTCCRF